MKRKSHLRFYTNLLLTSALAIGGSFSLAKLALAAGTSAGTVITNTATGSFDGATSGTSGTVTSNTVTLSVLEVAGITVVPLGTPTKASSTQITTDGLTPGPYQTSAEFTKGDIVYFDFTITNIGNSPTAFFIPDTATVTNGTQRGIRVIAVDPDGAGAVLPTTMNASVPVGGAITTAAGFLTTPATDGYIPVNGTVTVRVAVELTGVQVNDKTTVVLGSTVGTNADGSNGQNEDFVASGTNRDVYTSDLADGTTIPATYNGVGTIDQTVETNGTPVNGDATNHRKEAANNASTSITQGIDYGDLPDASVGGVYKTKLAFSSGYTNSGASHLINKTGQLFLGVLAPDAEADGQPTVNADGDNTNGTNDEDGVSKDGGTTFTSTMPPLSTSATNYSVTVKVTNTTGSNAYLAGWVDFNQNGVVDTGEVVYYNLGTNKVDPVTAGTNNLTLTWTVPTGLSPGVRYARFRLTTDTSVYTGGIGGTGIGTVTAPVPLMTAPLGEGEVEDYIINKVPGFNVVKRITNINGTDITGFAASTTVAGNTDPTDTKWPSANTQYLRGAVTCTTASPCNGISGGKPGDLVEYTIYFLSNGTDDIKNVQLCDRIPTNTTFEPDTYTTGKGILFGWDSSGGAIPDPANSTPSAIKVALTNTADADTGTFFAAGAPVPTTPCGGTSNPNGAIVVSIGSSTVIPAATGSGAPKNSYGFIRFKVKVN
jgi:uncharacterized repeat protein (TIGR01451 family)